MNFTPFRHFAGAVLVGALLGSTQAFAAPVRYQAAVFDQVEVKRDVLFRTTSGHGGKTVQLHLDVYSPGGDDEPARPAIVWLHGGGLHTGVDRKQGYIVTLATEFARRGYVSFSADYSVADARGRDGNPLPQAVADVQAAVDWIRSHAAEYRVDPSCIAIGGGSAGGFAGANVAGKPGLTPAPKPLFAFVDLWGSPVGPMQIVPIDRSYPPTLIMHGTADNSVPFAFSTQFARQLHDVGVKWRLVSLAGAGHTPIDRLPEILDQTTQFLFDALTAARAHRQAQAL